MVMQKNEEKTIELTSQQEKSLELIGNLYRQAVYSGNDLSEVSKIFSSSLLEQDNEMCQTIASEFIRYRKLLLNRNFFSTLRSQIDTLNNTLLIALPKNVSITIECRHKSFERTVEKVLLYYLKGDSIDLADLAAFRIIVDSLECDKLNEAYCYPIKDICIKHFLEKKHYTLCTPSKQVGSEPLIKNYIEVPKNSGYRSIHFALKDCNNNTFEVQIRTLDMHDDAEVGMASHNEYEDEKYKLVKKYIFFDPENVHIPNFKVLCDGSLYDKVGLKKAKKIEER